MSRSQTITIDPGNVVISTFNHATGERRRIVVHNLVVDTGLQKIIELMAYPDLTGDGYTPAYIAIGTGSTTVTAADTAMDAEVFPSGSVRKEITTRSQSAAKHLEYYLYLETTEANGNTLREVGLFTESTGGTLWARAVHPAVVKTALLSVHYEWTFIYAAT